MKKIVTVLGARPQFIKAASVSKALAEQVSLDEKIVHTGQHFDKNMSEIFFDELNIPKPAVNLGIAGGNHGVMTSSMMVGLEKLFLADRPDMVIVYGDTNSTLAGALAATKLGIPVAHVEAGLRSYNQFQPEEINRAATDAIAQLLFAPTQSSYDYLNRVSAPNQKVKYVGDVMYDAVLHFGDIAKKDTSFLNHLNLNGQNFILTTIHRAENTEDGNRLTTIMEKLIGLSKQTKVVFPLHPRTRNALKHLNLLNKVEKSLNIIEPQSYLNMLNLLNTAYVVVTDSGGLQKEAFFHKKPCITIRQETEWMELTEIGCNILTEPQGLAEAYDVTKKIDPNLFNVEQPFGKGDASQKIAAQITEYLNY